MYYVYQTPNAEVVQINSSQELSKYYQSSIQNLLNLIHNFTTKTIAFSWTKLNNNFHKVSMEVGNKPNKYYRSIYIVHLNL